MRAGTDQYSIGPELAAKLDRELLARLQEPASKRQKLCETTEKMISRGCQTQPYEVNQELAQLRGRVERQGNITREKQKVIDKLEKEEYLGFPT